MNSKQLKVLALTSMLFDHWIRIFPLSNTFAPIADWLAAIGQDTANSWLLEQLPHFLLYFGRLAAPVFLFCIVEGFLHTRSIPKYILRIFATAVLSQVSYILFDMAENHMYGIPSNWKEVPFNILFTLGLGLLMLWGYAKCKKKGRTLLGLGVVVCAAALAYLLSFEGSEGYILVIFAFYVTKGMPTWKKALLFVPVVLFARYRLVFYTLEDPTLLRTCALNIVGPYLGVLATCFYSGEKGTTSAGFQKFAYAFYPLHLLLLAVAGFLKTPFAG